MSPKFNILGVIIGLLSGIVFFYLSKMPLFAVAMGFGTGLLVSIYFKNKR